MPVLIERQRSRVAELREKAAAVHRRRRELIVKSRRLVQKVVVNRQSVSAWREVTKALIPFFVEQGRSMVARLRKIEEKTAVGFRRWKPGTMKFAEKLGERDTKSTVSDSAHGLVQLIFDPKEWRPELTNRLLPVLARKMAEAGVAHLMTYGVDVRRKRQEKKGVKYDPSQPRDELGRFGSGGGGSGDEGGGEGSEQYHPRREESYYGESVGGIGKQTHQFLVDWQDSPAAVPTESIISELGKYVPERPVVLYRGGKVEKSQNLKSWSYDREVAEGFAGEGERVIKRKWYPDEILVDFTRLPKAYRDDMDEMGMGTSLNEVVCAYGSFKKEMQRVRGTTPKRFKVAVPSSVKTTTASEWAEENVGDWGSLIAAFEASDLPLGILNEIPEWMQKSIAKRLSESFSQDYWDSVSRTTMGDAEKVLRQGLAEGWSIDDMAKQLREYFEEGGFRYARRRSENIARTESGNALNGARKDSVAQLQAELGPKVPMKQAWLSVLGITTRDTHANLDGVPENERGMWNLSGYEIPWPGHISLPPEERCNCMCSLTIEFGMDEVDAQREIEEYWSRVQEWESKGYIWPWQKYDPNQPRVPAGSPQGGQWGSGGGTGLGIVKPSPKPASEAVPRGVPKKGAIEDEEEEEEEEKESEQRWESQKYPGQPRDELGRFGSGGGSPTATEVVSRAERSKRTHKPSTIEKQQRGEAEQKLVSKAIGGENDGDNKPFDVIVGKHGIEVKTVMDNNNDKITVHPSSRRRKEEEARKQGLTMHTVAVDVRGGKRSYYYKQGVGAFRLSSMERTTLKQLKEKFQ